MNAFLAISEELRITETLVDLASVMAMDICVTQ